MARLTVTITVVMLSLVLAKKCTIEEYYWREFSGKIPADAYKLAGYLIGQVQISKSVVPVVIGENSTTGRYWYRGNYGVAKKNIKILCSQHKKRFQLVRANLTSVVSLYEQNKLVLMGFDGNVLLFLGLRYFNTQDRVGYIPIYKNTNRNVFHAISYGRPLHVSSYYAIIYNLP